MNTQQIGDKWAGEISKAFEEWAEDVRLNGRSNIPITRFNPEPLIESAFLAGGASQLAEIGKLTGMGVKFDLRNYEAEAWIKQYAADQVKYIEATQKKTIRQIVLRGFQEGLTQQEQSREIRKHIGLLPNHYTAVQNYKSELLKSGMDESTSELLTDKYRKKLLKYRADTIGLTEGHTAANEGFSHANEEAVKRGILQENEYLEKWLYTNDGKVCAICIVNNGKTAPIGELRIPAHPRCRCTKILVRNPDYEA